MSKLMAAVNGACLEIQEVHRPDNGLSTSCLELITLKYMQAELKAIQNDENGGPLKRIEGIQHLEDDSILGVSDKMLFYTKELKSSVENENKAHNPFVISKLDTESLKHFDFDAFQGYIRGKEDDDDGEEEAARKMRINRKNFGRFFPKLNERSSLIQMPSMLVLNCNIIETLRLRCELLKTLEQT